MLNIKNVHYCCMITGNSNDEAIKLLKNIDWTENNETL